MNELTYLLESLASSAVYLTIGMVLGWIVSDVRGSARTTSHRHRKFQ